MLDGQPVRVPSKAAGDMVSTDVGMPCYDVLMVRSWIPGDQRVGLNTYLDGPGKQMAIMGKPSGKRRAVVERKFRSTLGELKTCSEGIDLPPESEHFLLFFREIKWRRNWYFQVRLSRKR